MIDSSPRPWTAFVSLIGQAVALYRYADEGSARFQAVWMGRLGFIVEVFGPDNLPIPDIIRPPAGIVAVPCGPAPVCSRDTGGGF